MKYLLICCCLFLVACGASDSESQKSAATNASENTEGMGKAVELSNFSLPDLENKAYQLKDWEGQVVLLNFWATWCPPCRREMPGFVELDEEYSQQGLQMVGVAIDEKTAVGDFVDSLGIEFPILVGGLDAIGIAKQFGNLHGALPFSVIIDRKGYIRHQIAGELSKSEALDLIKPLL